MRKYDNIHMVDRELKKDDPNFKGFCLEVAYPFRSKKLLENYYHIMSQIPQDPLGEEERINLDSPEVFVVLEETND